ncbi:GyrI-like domain-containing protein [Kiritimatiellaeota bacterium B1221]|nr:GyrI-like domain-containing protein [Kiritimatiellaeota bacterium B1221]
MKKIDYKKELKHLYRPSANIPAMVEVPEMNYLMIDGEGDPNLAQSYGDAIAALYPVAYTLKFMVKRGGMEVDYGVPPLEALWWADDMSDFVKGNKSKWKWTAMIMQPEFITQDMVKDAIQTVRAKKDPVSLPRLRFESYPEGLCAQILHIGPFSEEGPTIEKLHRFVESEQHQLRGKHHEIYLTDIRRAAPKNWKTVIRQQIT